MTRKRYRKWLIFALCINICVIFIDSLYLFEHKIPDNLRVRVGNEEFFDFGLPFTATTYVDNQTVVNVNQEAIPENEISINLNAPFSLNLKEEGSYNVELKLFGITVKNIQVDAIEDVKLMPSGMPVGIHIKTDGIMILGTGQITSNNGELVEPAKNIVRSGDYVKEVNGSPVSSISEMVECINQCNGEKVILTLFRDGNTIEVSIEPTKTATNEYKIGVWIRDDTQGIGTLSFVDENNNFGALGHGITDVDTSLLIDINGGGLYPANVYSIVKGENGSPGEMVGNILYNQQEKLGKITKNTNAGIFGTLETPSSEYGYDESEAISIGLKQEITIGQAYIRCSVGGEVKDYEININSIDFNNSGENKDLIIEITDEELLNCTNGIIQGMSGSPIIQNNKLVGVVTHVFLNDCKKGYGIFIENMLSNLND